MNIQKVLFYGIITIIVILLIFNLKIHDTKEAFKKACVVNYSDFEKTEKCPCSETGKTDLLNLSLFNITFKPS